jgi:hypothetical protein
MRTTNNLIILITAVFLTLTFSCTPDNSNEAESKTFVYDIFSFLGLT